MKLPRHLPTEVLEDIVSDIQQLLWLDVGSEGDSWNANKEWDAETVECIAAVLEERGLRPNATGRTSIR